MEIRNHTTNMQMHPKLVEALGYARQERAFDAQVVLQAKADLLNSYYEQAGLSSAVIAISGGIDSAVVLGVVKYASQLPNSPIQHIVAITLPAIMSRGVTGQDTATRLAYQVCEAFDVETLRIDVGPIVESIINSVERELGHPGLPENIGTADPKPTWARGQAVSYARTPTYYYATSVLSAQGRPGLVIGTTNLSEGGYLGYFGKASDGMVDVQLISDLFKSEVYEVGRLLGVPAEILERAPTGDMFDATTDEVVFGAPYDFVELFTHMLWSTDCRTMVEQLAHEHEVDTGDGSAVAQLNEYWENLERMHRYNAHKYLGRSPAVHLDIMPAGVKNGWNNPAWRPE
jgi:NAD+ synthase (glutamine-hydrolysing)